MNIELAYPDKIVWPNGRGHWGPKSRAIKALRSQAYWATEKAMQTSGFTMPETLKIALTVHPKPKGPLPDKDNCVAACKAYLDGIADALKVNDRNFDAPTVTFGERRKYGAFVVVI